MTREEIDMDDPYNVGFHKEEARRDPAAGMPRWIWRLCASIGLMLVAWVVVYGCRGGAIGAKFTGEDPWVTVRTDTLKGLEVGPPFDPDHRPTRVVVRGGNNTTMLVAIEIQDEEDEGIWRQWIQILNPDQKNVLKRMCPTPTQLRAACNSYASGIATIEWQHLKAEEVKK